MAVDPVDRLPFPSARHLRAVPAHRCWSTSTQGVRVEVEVTAYEAIVSIRGEIDLANVDSLRDALRNVRALGASRIVVDASELDFLAVGAARELAAAQDVVIVGAYGISKRVLDLIAAANPS